MTVLETLEMAKVKGRARGRPKTSDRDDVTVRIDRKLASRAKHIAHHRGIAVAELISDLLEQPLDREYAVLLRELEGR